MAVKDLSPAVPKLLLKLLAALPAQNEQAGRESEETARHALSHMDQRLLDEIIRQVHAEGYYADFIKAFMAEDMSETDTMKAIRRWALQARLKVGFSRTGHICVFELG